MDIIELILANSGVILMVISVVLAFIARYFQAEAKVFADAAVALVELQQEFLNDIRDGVISQEELDQILAKIQAASAALKEVLKIFIKPVPVVEKFAMIFGAGSAHREIEKFKVQAQTMKMQRRK